MANTTAGKAAVNDNKTFFEISALRSPALEAALTPLDFNKDGTVSVSEMSQALAAYEAKKRSTKRLGKMLVVLATFLLIFTAIATGLMWTAAELAKDAKVGSDGVMRVAGGDKAVQVESTALRVDPPTDQRTYLCDCL